MNNSNVDVFDSKSEQNVTSLKKNSSDISLILKYSSVNMCFYNIYKFMGTFVTFNGDTTIGIIPTPVSGFMTFCDSFCFQKK